METNHGQEVTGQVREGFGDNANSTMVARPLSPNSCQDSCHSVIDSDAKLAEVYRLRVIELEKALLNAQIDRKPNHVPTRLVDRNEAGASIVFNEDHVIPIRASRPTVEVQLELPRVELTPFDGDAARYWKFMRQFETFVEAKVSNDEQRFLYLLHYCRGKAKEAIEECVLLPSEVGYQRAKRILKNLSLIHI